MATRRRALAAGAASGLLADAVVMNQVFFWLPDPARVLREVYRVLRPGGRLAMLSADRGTLTRIVMAPYIRGGACLRTDAEMERVLTAAGFADPVVASARLGVQFARAVKP